ncbi:MAG TPA: HlyD family efflux transporter periplasmic adaptor subunit [Bryobacteraceae bacterium]|jgi:HlyD family secretion protein|nr:HlyD family efflux transporter periplasmic adaptor subunit [Bryobacteraceae bacterium]
MDIQRKGVARSKMIRRVTWLTLTVAVLAVAGWRINQLKPASPTVERATVLIDTVKRGPMVIDVHGLGTLVPEDILWIQAEFDSQVSKIMTQSGDEVTPDAILLVLTNPQMEADANDYEWQAKQAEANYADLKVRLQSQTFDEQSLVSTAQGDLKQAQITKDMEENLLASHLESQLNAKLAVAKWEQADSRFQMEKQKLDIMKQSVDAQLEAQKVQIEKLRATWQLKKKQVDDLTIRAGIKGRMQEMTLQVGQRVKPGDVLAKVAQPWKLMARLQISETQAKDILLGQKATIDTRNGIVAGHVVRIDASIVNGTRTVDCKLDGPLPAGAVPDLSVDGTVEIDNAANVVYMQRPVSGQPDSSISLFKLDPGGREATRVNIRLGRLSVNTAEIRDGLQPGDQVILSDTPGQEQAQHIRLN